MAAPLTGVDKTLPVDEKPQLTRAVIASTVGTAIEWYDFFLYGTAAALVFNRLFFPTLQPWSGTMAAFECASSSAELITTTSAAMATGRNPAGSGV